MSSRKSQRQALLRFLSSTLILASVILIIAPSAKAQDIFGRISGTVTDASGAVVPDAKLTLANEATQARRDLTTDRNGYFAADDVSVGTYRVTAEKPGCGAFGGESQPRFTACTSTGCNRCNKRNGCNCYICCGDRLSLSCLEAILKARAIMLRHAITVPLLFFLFFSDKSCLRAVDSAGSRSWNRVRRQTWSTERHYRCLWRGGWAHDADFR